MTKKAKLTNAVIVVLLLAGVAWIASLFVHLGGEYTDNAQVMQNLVDVNARVQGFVEKINVEEYSHVDMGDTLMLIEDAEFRLHLAQAEAALASAKAGQAAMSRGITTIKNNAQVTDAGIVEVEILLRNAEADYKRYQALYEQNAVTKQQLDAIQTQYESLKAKVQTMRRQQKSTLLAGDEQSERVNQSEAGIAVAEAALNLARLNLSYCTVLAPCSGYTGRKMVQEGELYWQQQTEAGNYGLRQASLAGMMAEKKLNLAKSAMLPQLAFVAEEHLDGPVTIEIPALDKNFNYWFVGVGLRYNLSSLYKSRHDVRRARVDQAKADKELSYAREQLGTAVHASNTALQTARAELTTSEKQVQLATENYDVVSNRYMAGLALITDMLDAFSMKLSAEIALEQSRIEILYCQKQLQYLTGTL